jgi:hypothetical protein
MRCRCSEVGEIGVEGWTVDEGIEPGEARRQVKSGRGNVEFLRASLLDGLTLPPSPSKHLDTISVHGRRQGSRKGETAPGGFWLASVCPCVTRVMIGAKVNWLWELGPLQVSGCRLLSWDFLV